MLLVWGIYQKIYGPVPYLWDVWLYFNEGTIEFR